MSDSSSEPRDDRPFEDPQDRIFRMIEKMIADVSAPRAAPPLLPSSPLGFGRHYFDQEHIAEIAVDLIDPPGLEPGTPPEAVDVAAAVRLAADLWLEAGHAARRVSDQLDEVAQARLADARALRDSLVVVNSDEPPDRWTFRLTADQVVELERLLGIQ